MPGSGVRLASVPALWSRAGEVTVTWARPRALLRAKNVRLPPGNGATPAASAATPELDWLPVASLLVTSDGEAFWANQAWVTLTGAPDRDSAREGWLTLLDPHDRAELLTLLRSAAEGRSAGSAEFRILTPGAATWTEWSWRPGPPGLLAVSVVSLGEFRPRDDWSADLTDLANMVAHRLSGVGLLVRSAAGYADDHWRVRLENAVDDLDLLIRDVRSAIFSVRVKARVR
jgi:PAS domain-containing protein